jgi:hypothetical protein
LICASCATTILLAISENVRFGDPFAGPSAALGESSKALKSVATQKVRDLTSSTSFGPPAADKHWRIA